MRFLRTVLVAALVVAVVSPLADAQERTIFLEIGPGGSVAMNVTYHSGFEYYYGGYGGFVGSEGFVWDVAGKRIQDAVPNIDQRAWNYNPSEDQLEICSYNAQGGGGAYGLIMPGLDEDGLLTGETTLLLASVPGLISTQTMPAYDPANDVLYSRDRAAAVNVVKRSDGSLVRSFTLSDAPTLTDYAIGYDETAKLIVVTTTDGNRALAYDTDGNYVDEWNLDVTVPSNYRMGYTNGQLFVFDDARNGWQGYDLGLRTACPCDLIKKFKVKCKNNKLKVIVKSRCPEGSNLTFIDNGEETEVVTNNKGKAKMKKKRQTGMHTVSIKECPEFEEVIDCG